MPKLRIYQSREWLNFQLNTLKLNEEQIAKKAGCSRVNIHSYLIQFGLYRKR